MVESIWEDGCGMKTTVEIADSLLDEAKVVASNEETTLRKLIEDGLRRELAERKRRRKFRLRRASFKGKGMQPGVESWDRIRDLAYEGRGT